jgi:hypothetical protein
VSSVNQLVWLIVYSTLDSPEPFKLLQPSLADPAYLVCFLCVQGKIVDAILDPTELAVSSEGILQIHIEYDVSPMSFIDLLDTQPSRS